MFLVSHSEAETKTIAKSIATTLTGSMVVALHGDLGAGKTVFVKGIAEALGIVKKITSPTFTLMNVYELKANSSKLKAFLWYCAR